jgi:hypothetical protein
MWEGAIYEGQVLDGRRHGYGTMRFTGSPHTYEGFWRDGQRHGRGTLYFNEENTAYYNGGLHAKSFARPIIGSKLQSMNTAGLFLVHCCAVVTV